MISNILEMLKLTEHYGVSENIEIAKGKYERPKTFKKLINQIKRWKKRN